MTLYAHVNGSTVDTPPTSVTAWVLLRVLGPKWWRESR